MAYTVAELITRSLYLSGIVSRGYSTPTAQEMSDGLYLLNDLLAFTTVDNALIPYFTQYNFNAVIGQETYNVPSLIEVETLTYVYSQDVRNPIQMLTREQYFNMPRVNNIETLPIYGHMELAMGGANIYIYPLPDQAYPFTLWGKFGLSQVTSYETDLSLTYDPFYLKYLRYALADYFCSEYGFSVPPQTKQELEATIAKLQYFSPMDFTVHKSSTLQQDKGFNWGLANLSHGWTT